jgi:adenylate cyclase
VYAALQVAQGNLQVQVEVGGNDEVADLANSFSYMIAGLREGSMYRDLLGRTVSPEVRERMREAISSGRLRLQGQDVVASVLFADIRGFTTLAEKAPPNIVLGWLNEYFGEIVPIITEHSGVVNKFDGDAVLAFFGILPVELAPEASAYHACRAALAMLGAIECINARRAERGEPLFITGIGVSTGAVTAGGLGTADRMTYTIIGDTVNTANRLQELTRAFGASGIVVSEQTRLALGERQSEFRFEPLGDQVLRGKQELQAVARLWAEAES